MRALIESVQPYKLGSVDALQLHLLRWLRELDDADKHRAIRPVFLIPAGFESVVRTVTAGKVTLNWPLVPIRDNSTLCEITGDAVTEIESPVESILTIGLSVIPEHPEHPRAIHDVLDSMFNAVVYVAQQFRELLN